GLQPLRVRDRLLRLWTAFLGGVMVLAKSRQLGLAAALVSTACFRGGEDVPLVGAWESDDRVGGYRNLLDIDEDLTGSATLYFYFNDDPALYYADYIAVATELDASNSYLISMICEDSCSDFDFTMTCVVI